MGRLILPYLPAPALLGEPGLGSITLWSLTIIVNPFVLTAMVCRERMAYFEMLLAVNCHRLARAAMASSASVSGA